MSLRSLTLKGFKSFPDRTTLEFAPGVSVIVGPNGSGKSNVTDAVLWALGEQSPLAVRGQKMQDVIFAGGHGVASRTSAEVEVVVDDASGAFGSEFSELSVRRRLDRSGEGEYRINGARCRLVDVIEALSDSGLGREMHSVVSQGRVEAIVHSSPHDRRMLIEEAAGLSKHRKRRRRAQLKVERTKDNLARALDVEREARSRLRPLKRQADAAALHERVERQVLEVRLELDHDALRASSEALAAHDRHVRSAHEARDKAERELAAVAARREGIERAFAEHSRTRDARSAALHAARSAAERIAMRTERAAEVARLAAARAARGERELASLEPAGAGPSVDGESARRIEELETEIARLAEDRARALDAELAALRAEVGELELRETALRGDFEQRRRHFELAEEAVSEAHAARAEAERRLEHTRREAVAAGAELASVNQFLRSAAGTPAQTRALGEQLVVEPGYEQAVAAALGSLLRAAIADDIRGAERILDEAEDGGSALIGDRPAPPAPTRAPAPGARRMLDVVRPTAPAARFAERLLRDAWLVESLEQIDVGFTGIAATRSGRVLFAATGELRQAAAAGEGRILEQRARRDELVRASERAVGEKAAARSSCDAAHAAVGERHAARDRAESQLREARRALDDAGEQVRRVERLIEGRSGAPDEGPAAARAAALRTELRAERRLAEQAAREREERRQRIESLRARGLHDDRLARLAEGISETLALAGEAVVQRVESLRSALEADEALAASTASDLGRCAQEEATVQARLREASDALTAAEVKAQRLRDAADEARARFEAIVAQLGFAPPQAPDPLTDERRVELDAQLERLERRRAQIGPVNPLAGREYEEALDHVAELESQREDLEAALRELEGVISDTDRRIRRSFEETFATAARNFEDTARHLFPGGRGMLRLVSADPPRAAGLAGAEEPVPGEGAETKRGVETPDGAQREAGEPGVEIEVTPAGKATKRLSLMSGGEKSLVALAFLFAVFLARPCPFYILDEVEAALDDANIDRFLELVRRSAERAQFIIVTHQKRTMEAADRLYGVSMGTDGVSKVVSRELGAPGASDGAADAGSDAAAEAGADEHRRAA